MVKLSLLSRSSKSLLCLVLCEQSPSGPGVSWTNWCSILGTILNCGGGPRGGYISGKYWQDPRAFHNGFKGLRSVFVNAAFAFSGTELVGLAAAETSNPRKSLPTAIRQVF